MKFKTFQALLIGGGIVVSGAVCFAIYQAVSDTDSVSSPSATNPPRSPAQSAKPSARDYRDDLIALLGRFANGETKIKDRLGSGSPKVNVYADAGVWNRAKVDLDRDEKWDEKWRWEAGIVYQASAPLDDEAYGPEQIVAGPASEAKPATSKDEPPAKTELRDVDTLMLELRELPVQTKIKDASKGRSFKINLYSDDGQRFNRAKVDLDRDDKWDEQWTFKPDGAVEREVAPDDDENYAQRFVLEAGLRWLPIAPG